MPEARPTTLPSGSVYHSDPEILGIPVFVGTRVPVQILIDHIRGGATLDEFLEDFPSVSRAQAEAFLVLREFEDASSRSELTLTEAHRQEIRRRLEAYRRDPSIGIPAEEVFRELEELYG